ncbi:MAG TPA: glutamate 5-kinase [Lacipirellulaceae bacterium]|jgi:glutamate 5-kinase|nr:glutamate 5-kinase [Lacipirellulaceae bacterium]
MPDLVRQQIAARSKTIVVKVGTRVLAHEDGTLDQTRITAIAEQLVLLMKEQRQIVLVSSGAVGAGIGRLGLQKRPADLAQLQAVAAIGQSRLIESYNRALEGHGRHAAQILLTADDLNERTRYLNIRNTLLAIFEYGALPIINENDTVRVDELQRNVGDNDRLAAMVANLLRAPLLVLLSDVDGLYDRHPKEAGAKVISRVEDLDAAIQDFQRQSPAAAGPNNLSRGGMASKLEAARLAVTAGESVVIANGRRPNVLVDLLKGEDVGTLFATQGPAVASRKRWIGLTAQPNGRIGLDAGATRAVQDQGRSLLAIGIRNVDGSFQKGDVISLCGEGGDEFARGLTNYGSDELRRIAGQPSDRIVTILGYCPHEEVVHRDNLVILS